MFSWKALRFRSAKDVVLPLSLSLRGRRKKAKTHDDSLGPPLRCSRKLKEMMIRHYYLARLAKGVKPVAWVTSGAPVELLRALDFYTVYPENHGALCGAGRAAQELCAAAERQGYSPDLCSYARTDLGHAFSGGTPVGKLPEPDLLFCSNNICQTVQYWFKQLAYHRGIPLVLFDAPFIPDGESEPSAAVAYMAAQLRACVPKLERISRREFDENRFSEVLRLSKESSESWGRVLSTLKARPAPMTIFDAFVHLAPIVSLRGLPVCLDYYHTLLSELEERVGAGIGGIREERTRLMWDNIAVWFKLRDFSRLFASHGCSFVCATYTNAWAETMHFLDAKDPFEALARAYGQVILNRGLGYRAALMERMIGEYQVDGLVFHSDRSCKPYSIGQYQLQRTLAERCGVKTVVIEADMTDPRSYSEEQTSNRLQAFLEM